MRKMLYKLENGVCVNSYKAAAGHKYEIILVPIAPPDEIANRIKFNKARAEKGLRGLPVDPMGKTWFY